MKIAAKNAKKREEKEKNLGALVPWWQNFYDLRVTARWKDIMRNCL